MIVELLPMLKERGVTLSLTIADPAMQTVRLLITPHRARDGEPARLTQPIEVIDTAERLDAQLGPGLIDFVHANRSFADAIAELTKGDAAAAAQAAGKKTTTVVDKRSSKPAEPKQQPALPDPDPEPIRADSTVPAADVPETPAGALPLDDVAPDGAEPGEEMSDAGALFDGMEADALEV